jgi:hypothetical protein
MKRNIMSASLVYLAAAPKRQVYLAFLCLLAALTILSGQTQMLWRLWQIAQDPATAAGVVTHLDCANHGHVDFVLRVESASFDGREHFVDGIACPQLRVGQRIAVYYQRAQPANNYALAASEDGGNRAMTAFYTGAAFLGAFVLVGPLFLVMVFSLFTRMALRMQGL